jgi:thiol peroxidase
MAKITLKGNPINTSGTLPAAGKAAPDSTLLKADLSESKVSGFQGKKILNIFPSIDTPVCATSVRTFHERAGSMKGVTVINISADLPFAQKRFCGAEGIENATCASTFRSSFGKDYGVEITDGPLKGLMARAIVVLDATNKVVHSELVPEIAQEPNYDAALNAAK